MSAKNCKITLEYFEQRECEGRGKVKWKKLELIDLAESLGLLGKDGLKKNSLKDDFCDKIRKHLKKCKKEDEKLRKENKGLKKKKKK